MGYEFDYLEQLSFHHLLLSHKLCKEHNVKNEGYELWNGAVLNQNSSHTYLHIIENYDFERFLAITMEMYDENIKGYLDYNNLLYINEILNSFEREYCGVRNENGNLIIKEKYTRRRIKRI